MQQGLLIALGLLAIYWLASGGKDGLTFTDVNVVKADSPMLTAAQAAAAKSRREGFAAAKAVGRENASLSKAAMGVRRYNGGREGFGAGELMGTVYGMTAGADGSYAGYDPAADFGGCVDSNDKANADATDYQEYVHNGHLAYGADVIRNHQKWVSDVAPFSQTAAISPDDLSIDEMRASELQGISAWSRPAPAVSSDARQVFDQTQDEINDAATKAGGFFNDPSPISV
jgi:hypothetical protein